MKKLHGSYACLLLLLLCPALVLAQSLPVPREFYFDDDAHTTRPIVAVQGSGEEVIDRLASNMQRRKDDVESRAQLARIAMQSDRTELGHRLYGEALRAASGKVRLLRTVGWNYGWDLYRSGNAEGALEQWSKLVGGWPAAPSWQPPTFALVLWTLGRQREAVEWYAAAVRTEPTLWGDPGNHERLLPDWTGRERAILAEVHQAWQASPSHRR